MTALKLIRFMARCTLATLPFAAAAVFVTYFARDLNETASAVLAGATLLSAASLVVLGILIRDVRRFGEKQDDTRLQALALAGCMKAFHLRMAELELAQSGREAAPSRETIPSRNDPLQNRNKPVSGRDALVVLPVDAFSERLIHARVTAPLDTSMTRSTTPIITLPQRKLWGVEIMDTAEAALPALRLFGKPCEDDRLLESIRTARQMIDDGQFSNIALAVASAGLALATRSADLLAQLADDNPVFRTRFLLGVSQKTIRQGGAPEAQALARLARHGLRFALVDITDFRIDPEALAACSISHVRIDARRLIEASEDELTAEATAASQLARRLKAGGITLMCSGIDDERMTRELCELGVEMAQGPDLHPARQTSNVVVPWRAAPAELPRLPASYHVPAELRRAAG